MYSEIVHYLRCPACRGQLALDPAAIDDGEVVAGELRCAACGAAYAVRDGIADLLGPTRPTSPAQQVNDWRLTAWGYERLWRPFALTLLSGQPFPYRRELPLVAALVAPRRGGLYLDIACSNGLYARALARAMRGAPGHVVGIDHSLVMLLEARRRARAAGLRISYVRARAQALPLVGGAADGAAIGGSLNEIGDLDGCLAELRRALAPDGRFLAMTLTRATTPAGRLLQRLTGPGGISFWTAADLAGHFARAGLRLVARWQYGVVLFTLCLASNEQ